jgi:hypothetical protein
MEAIEESNNYSFSDCLQNVLKYKISLIMYILSFFVFTDALAFFGGYSAFVSVVAFILLYFFSSVYKQYIPINASPLSDYTQAKKVCEMLGGKSKKC